MPERRRYERTPDTIAILGGLAVAGGIITAAGVVPPSVDALAPTWVGLMWSATFTTAAAVSLAGVLLRDAVMGWSLELVGRIPLCVTACTYVWVLASTATGLGPAVTVGLLAAVGVSSGVRAWQLTRRLRDHLRAYRNVVRRLGLHRPRGGRQ